MYKKYVTALILSNLILATAFFAIKWVEIDRLMATPAFQLEVAEILAGEECASFKSLIKTMTSGQRIVDYEVMERKPVYELSEEDYEALLRIVEAEAGGEDENGKLLVANVVLNRLNNNYFPDTVKEVIFQRENGTTQFSPIRSGKYYTVTISEETIAVVDRAVMGEDISEGALFFASRKYADPDRMRWFDEKLTFLFEYGGHEFFQ